MSEATARYWSTTAAYKQDNNNPVTHGGAAETAGPAQRQWQYTDYTLSDPQISHVTINICNSVMLLLHVSTSKGYPKVGNLQKAYDYDKRYHSCAHMELN